MLVFKRALHFLKGYSTFERIFWAITYGMSFCGLTIFCYYTLERFYTDPVSMVVDNEYNQWDSIFPAVSICLLKGKAAQSILKLIKKPNITYEMSDTTFSKNVLSCMFENPINLDEQLLNCDELRSKYGVNYEELREQTLPKNCNRIMEFVSYNNENYRCDEIFKFHKTTIGPCFIANSIVDYDYTFEKLKLKYNIATKRRILSMRLKASKVWLYSLHVHSPENLPYYNALSKPIFGIDTNISYNIAEIITDPDAAEKSISERGCRFPNEELDGSPFHYSFSTCMSFIRINEELQECNCTFSTSPKIYSKQYCNSSGVKCIIHGDINSKARQAALERKICVPSCTEQIIQETWQTDGEPGNNPLSTHLAVEIANLPFVRYKRAVIRSKLDLSVSIAGLAGLFFGVSVLNLVEVLYYLATVKK